MAFSVGEFFESAIDFGTDFIGEATDFISAIGLEDVATLATAGLALNQLFAGPQTPEVPDFGKAQQRGAEIVAQQGEAPDVRIGDDEEESAGERATRAGLRVRRTFDPGISLGAGQAGNPLAIQI